MNKHTKLQKKAPSFWFLLGLIIMQFFIPGLQHAEPEKTEPLNFTLKSIDGEEVSLKDYRGKKIVHLIFWATWCPHCLMEMPKVNELSQSLGKKPYEALAVDVGINESIKRIRKIQKQYKIPCKILLDENGMVTRLFKIVGVPCHIIIGTDGGILDQVNELPKDPLTYMKKFLPPEEKTVPVENP
jgi:peroxiredoxin